eukprot:TRINITY_DN22863_c0_g1_i1.p2 TRINITY_DN22863_c0_g1~~TRINITY_DN22863_c0_g1_i1.p2  ORF type:complete len:136 (-),score=27.27 TRINITY_DN22863_c0_g1_i1:56-463(-)
MAKHAEPLGVSDQSNSETVSPETIEPQDDEIATRTSKPKLAVGMFVRTTFPREKTYYDNKRAEIVKVLARVLRARLLEGERKGELKEYQHGSATVMQSGFVVGALSKAQHSSSSFDSKAKAEAIFGAGVAQDDWN